MNKPRIRETKAFLDAKLAASENEVVALSNQLCSANAEIERLRTALAAAEDELAIRRRGGKPPMRVTSLKDEYQRLVADGVPCTIKGGHIIHSKTGAVLA